MKSNRYLLAAVMALSLGSVNAEVLPHPQTTGGMPLMEAIAARQSSRDIDYSQTVSKQEISNLCWAAWGITHDGKHTIATAMNRQELTVYVITEANISRYNPESGTLTVVASGDYREAAGKQEFAQKAPVNLIFVVDTEKQPNADCQAYAAAAASQNVYLYCAQAGLKTVLRGSFDAERLKELLKLSSTERVVFAQTVGR